MNDINIARVLLGGVVAGLIIAFGELVLNGVVLAGQWAALRQQHLLEAPGANSFAGGAVITLCYGIVLVWMYAAFRPRFGPGPGTAIVAALTFWFIAYVLFLLSLWANGFATFYLAAVSIVWGLLEASLAALAGAWLYREKDSA
jgi:hypothetical protein